MVNEVHMKNGCMSNIQLLLNQIYIKNWKQVANITFLVKNVSLRE